MDSLTAPLAFPEVNGSFFFIDGYQIDLFLFPPPLADGGKIHDPFLHQIETYFSAEVFINPGKMLIKGRLNFFQYKIVFSDFELSPVRENILEPEGKKPVMQFIQPHPAFLRS